MPPQTHVTHTDHPHHRVGRRRRSVTLIVAAALVLAACGGTDDATQDPTPAATTAAESSATGAATPTAPVTEGATSSPGEAGSDAAEPTGDATVAVAPSDLGDILVDADGMTLYQFDNDSQGTSACTGDCLGSWPPLLAQDPVAGDGVAGELATFERADTGEIQVMVNGAPLYHWAGDAEPGDVSGHGVGEVWWAVTPAGEAVPAAAAASIGDEPNLAEGVDDGGY